MPKVLVGVADIKYPARISFYPHGIVYDVADHTRPWIGPAVIEFGDTAHIVQGFRITRNAGAARYRARPGVVSRQAELDVAAVALQQLLKVANPGVHILLRVKRVGHV